ncbi:MAG: DNA topoisomerase I [Candidatus Woesearchaeota archaeon]
MTELIITEKPSSAKKIAEALSTSKLKKEVSNGVTVFSLSHKDKDIRVVSAVGHLHTVSEKTKSFAYPVFDIEWRPIHEVNKKAAFSKKYLDVIKKEAKKAKEFTVACDYDIEGEVIGLNAIRFGCMQKDASRMKFSTLVKGDIIKSYNNKMSSIDWGQARAGETRHFIDWLYGINISRALSTSVKKAGSFKILSSGRVQSPALKIVVDKEKEIRAFVPVPYWQVMLKLEFSKLKFEANHEKDKFWVEDELDVVYNKVKSSKSCVVKDVSKKKFNQAPPFPFDLGSLQSEAYKVFGISPKATLQLAQSLYLQGLTSYPRTSSQKLPKELDLKKLIADLAKMSLYKDKANFLLSKNLIKPNEGKKDDPAHPAIYPTGVQGKITDERELKIYDLIVKRFLACFGEPAIRETVTAKLSVSDEVFISKGTSTVIRAWHDLYAPYVKLSEDELPLLKVGDVVDILKVNKFSKETQPPKRYTPASLMSELEKRGLGTKATRADIVEALYDRGYIHEKSIQATELGIRTEDVMEKYFAELTDEEFTRFIEEEMDLIRQKKKEPSLVLDEAKERLTIILDKIRSNEKTIGSELLSANRETIDTKNLLGPCNLCKDGSIMIKRGKFGAFAACDNYPDCKNTFNLPKSGLVKPAGKVSEGGFPMIQVIVKGKQPFEMSLNPAENAKLDSETKEEYAGIEDGSISKKCPKCGSDLRVMSSIYGKFLGCSAYPKCKHTESPNNGVGSGSGASVNVSGAGGKDDSSKKSSSKGKSSDNKK